MARVSKEANHAKALRRLKALRSVYEKPDAVRRQLGLKRRKTSRSQRLLKFFAG